MGKHLIVTKTIDFYAKISRRKGTIQNCHEGHNEESKDSTRETTEGILMSGLNDFTKKELIEIISGLLDVIHGRTITSEELSKKLK